MDLLSFIMAFYVNVLCPSMKPWIFIIAMVDWLSSNRVIDCIEGQVLNKCVIESGPECGPHCSPQRIEIYAPSCRKCGKVKRN